MVEPPLGVVGLFITAIDSFDYIQLGNALSKDDQHAQLKLDILRLRLSRWGRAVNIYNEPDRTSVLAAERKIELVKEVLVSICNVFQQAKTRASKYKLDNNGSKELEVDKEDESDLTVLHSKMKELVKSKQKEISRDQQIRWAIYLSKEFTRLIDDVTEFVTILEDLFPIADAKTKETATSDINEVLNDGEIVAGPEIDALESAAKKVDPLLKKQIRAVKAGYTYENITSDDTAKLSTTVVRFVGVYAKGSFAISDPSKQIQMSSEDNLINSEWNKWEWNNDIGQEYRSRRDLNTGNVEYQYRPGTLDNEIKTERSFCISTAPLHEVTPSDDSLQISQGPTTSAPSPGSPDIGRTSIRQYIPEQDVSNGNSGIMINFYGSGPTHIVISGRIAAINYHGSGDNRIKSSGSIQTINHHGSGDNRLTSTGHINTINSQGSGDNVFGNTGHIDAIISHGSGDNRLTSTGKISAINSLGSGDNSVINNGHIDAINNHGSGVNKLTSTGHISAINSLGSGNNSVNNSGHIDAINSHGSGDNKLTSTGHISAINSQRSGNNSVNNNGHIGAINSYGSGQNRVRSAIPIAVITGNDSKVNMSRPEESIVDKNGAIADQQSQEHSSPDRPGDAEVDILKRELASAIETCHILRSSNAALTFQNQRLLSKMSIGQIQEPEHS